MRELRYNPITGQWIMVSSVRRERRWRPTNYCPFCPGAEETGYGWDTLVLLNKFAVLSFESEDVKSKGFYRKTKANGECGVIIETPIHDIKDLDEFSIEQLVKVIKQWINITEKYIKDKRIIYLMIFRNKGEEIGVSLTHPHGQYYAMPFIPLRIRNMIQNSRNYFKRYNECIFCKIIKEEAREKVRVIYENQNFITFLPYYASWPFELHIYPKNHLQYITQLNEDQIIDFADALKLSLSVLNNLFNREMPYSFALIQAPLRGNYHDIFHMHLEIYPILRDKDKIKYAAGIEMSTWDFTYDGVPEENAKMLKETCKKINKPYKGKCVD
ncbi:galactose-1-phosphate uridylyltransferase [Caldisphaera lagunensis]|uniref:galactose-1-phosphate uridylyltransferase n=1 Tax=Caldisphaera lagunensis TaxID=200415 RepID=UPI0006627F72|nr:galactose-1-phosphate uridylyltransferase [Caldisphaera lagunensis]